MTDEDRIREQGLMVDERRKLKAHLACLENKKTRIDAALVRARDAVTNQSEDGNWQVVPKNARLAFGVSGSTDIVEYPDGGEILHFLTERKSTIGRL